MSDGVCFDWAWRELEHRAVSMPEVLPWSERRVMGNVRCLGCEGEYPSVAAWSEHEALFTAAGVDCRSTLTRRA